MQGFGIARFSNGEVYEGEYENGIIYGKGVYKWIDGRIYEG